VRETGRPKILFASLARIEGGAGDCPFCALSGIILLAMYVLIWDFALVMGMLPYFNYIILVCQ
jgi:hypothetical protein